MPAVLRVLALAACLCMANVYAHPSRSEIKKEIKTRLEKSTHSTKPHGKKETHPAHAIQTDLDLERRKSKQSWVPYDPSIKNNEALFGLTKAGTKMDSTTQLRKQLATLYSDSFEHDSEEESPRDINLEEADLETFLNRQQLDFPCLHLVLTRSVEAPKPNPESYRDSTLDQLQQRTSSFILDTFLGDSRPLYVSGEGSLRDGVQKSLEELFQLLSMDHRPLVTQVTFLSGFANTVTFVIQSINGGFRIFTASPRGSFGLQDWIAPEDWQIKALSHQKDGQSDEEEIEIPVPKTDFEAAKFGFGSGLLLRNATLVAYRNNLRQFFDGLCVNQPTVDYYFSALALWGTSDGFIHSTNCNFHYEVYEYSPEFCYQQAITDSSQFTGGEKAYPEFGFSMS